jgi:hypothetical protein
MFCTLTHCHQATQNCAIGLPRVVDGSRVSTFPYTTYCTYVCQLFCLTYCFRVIVSLMQYVWVSSYKQTDPSWPPIFRTIRLQQRDHSFRSLSSPSVSIMALRRNVLQEDDILWELYVVTRSDYSDNESLDSDSDVPTSSRKQLWSSTGPLTPQFPHPFFSHIYQDNFYNSVRLAQPLLDRNGTVCSTMRANSGIPRDQEEKGTWSKKKEVSVPEEWWSNGASVERQDLREW